MLLNDSTLLNEKKVKVMLCNFNHFSFCPHFQSLFSFNGVPCILKKLSITSSMFFFIVDTDHPIIAPSNVSFGYSFDKSSLYNIVPNDIEKVLPLCTEPNTLIFGVFFALILFIRFTCF